MGGVGQLVGDPLLKLYDPFIGIRGQGRKCCGCETQLMYRWRIKGFPLAFSNFSDPMTINCRSTTTGLREIVTSRYTLNASSGYFLEGEFEGLVDITRNFRGSMWVQGHVNQVEGKGQVTSTVTASDVLAPDGVVPGVVDIDKSKIYNSFFALGLGLETYF